MIEEERVLEVSPDRVWSVVGDIARWAEYLPTVTTVTPRGGSEPTQEGSEYVLEQPGLPPLTYRVSRWNPGRGFDWMATSVGVRTIGTHDVRAQGTGSLLRLGLRWEGPMAAVVRVLFGRKTARFVQQEADAFARLASGRV